MASANSTKRRRGRGEGSICQRSDGRWLATISLGVGSDGKRRRRTIYGSTKREVQDELAKLQAASANRTLVNLSRMKLGEYLDMWLADVASMKVRPTTLANYKGVIQRHIAPRIGGLLLQKLEPSHVQSLYATIARDGAGPSPCRLAHAVLTLALKHAMRQGLLVHNVCERVERPKVSKSKIEPLTQRQVAALLSVAAGDRLEALYHLAIGSGMRMGEIFGLHWSSVDLVAGTVSVKQSLADISGKLSLTEPKSKCSRRMIDLPQHAITALEAHRRRVMAEGFGGVDFVFCNHSGGPLRKSHFHAHDFKPLLKRAGLPDIRFHDLRHTHATLCLAAGENPKVVQERLGHANVGITLDTYSHLLPSMKTGAAARLDAIVTAAMAEHEIGCQSVVKIG